jgi:hypothetical protein
VSSLYFTLYQNITLKTDRSTANLKVENLDTATGLPQWETVEEDYTPEQVQEVVQELNKQESTAQPTEAQPGNNSNHAPPPGISQVLLDSSWSKHISTLSLHC